MTAFNERTGALPIIDALKAVPGAAAFLESLGELRDEREAVAHACASLIGDSGSIGGLDAVFLDAGSTAYFIAEALLALGRPRRVLSNNYAVALRLAGSPLECHQVGGRVDDIHLCTIGDRAAFDATVAVTEAGAFTAVLTAAAFRVDGEELWFRARRPDQFDLKRHILATAAEVIVAAESSKFTMPFDGQHAFRVERRGITLVVDDALEQTPAAAEALRATCSHHGHDLHLVARTS